MKRKDNRGDNNDSEKSKKKNLLNSFSQARLRLKPRLTRGSWAELHLDRFHLIIITEIIIIVLTITITITITWESSQCSALYSSSPL